MALFSSHTCDILFTLGTLRNRIGKSLEKDPKMQENETVEDYKTFKVSKGNLSPP